MEPLNMKDIAIIDAFPAYDWNKVILEIGCGDGKLDFYLAEMGYHVYATDIKQYESWQDTEHLTFHTANIFDLTNFPISLAPIVICSQVLEHLRDYKKALMNLIKLTEIKLILTFPYKRSFRSPGHVNFWDDRASGKFKDVHEFVELCKPYSVSISKIITKPKDAETEQRDYLIIIDRRQKYAYLGK